MHANLCITLFTEMTMETANVISDHSCCKEIEQQQKDNNTARQFCPHQAFIAFIYKLSFTEVIIWRVTKEG